MLCDYWMHLDALDDDDNYDEHHDYVYHDEYDQVTTLPLPDRPRLPCGGLLRQRLAYGRKEERSTLLPNVLRNAGFNIESCQVRLRSVELKGFKAKHPGGSFFVQKQVPPFMCPI